MVKTFEEQISKLGSLYEHAKDVYNSLSIMPSEVMEGANLLYAITELRNIAATALQRENKLRLAAENLNTLTGELLTDYELTDFDVCGLNLELIDKVKKTRSETNLIIKNAI